MIYFIADTHFGHRAICKYRPQFKDPLEHDELIINNWNKVVKSKNAIVWVLGDMCMFNKSYDMSLLINRLNGNIRLIPGNHDYMPYYKDSKVEVCNGLVSKYKMWLSHCPIHPNEIRGKAYNMHGHVHNKSINNKQYINVCVEKIGYTPISLDEIRSLYFC